MNPEPTPSLTKAMLNRPLVFVWTLFNVDILFKNARVGKDESIGARVERLLAMCRHDSVAASRLVDLYTEIQREHARKKAENENNRDAGLDQEKAELDAAHIRLKATLQALRAARTAKEDLAEDSTDARAVANMQIAMLQTQLEEDRMRMTVAKEILQTSREMFPVDTAYTDDQLWEMLRGLVHSQCVNATPQTELDRLRALRKGAKESWVNFF